MVRHVPPKAHLVKAHARLYRLNALMPPEALARTKAQQKAAGGPTLQDRRQYADELALVLRDYERILHDLLPETTDD